MLFLGAQYQCLIRNRGRDLLSPFASIHFVDLGLEEWSMDALQMLIISARIQYISPTKDIYHHFKYSNNGKRLFLMCHPAFPHYRDLIVEESWELLDLLWVTFAIFCSPAYITVPTSNLFHAFVNIVMNGPSQICQRNSNFKDVLSPIIAASWNVLREGIKRENYIPSSRSPFPSICIGFFRNLT